MFRRKPRIPQPYKSWTEELMLGAIQWLDHRGRIQPWPDYEARAIRLTMGALLSRRVPLGHDDIVTLLDWSIRQPNTFVRGTPLTIKALQNYLKEHDLTPALKNRIGRLAELLESGYATAETRRWAVRLKELGGLATSTLPLVPGEAWSDSAIEEIEAMDGETRMAWVRLLNLCATASGAKPTAKWLKEADALLERIGHLAFENAVARWFRLVDKPRTQPIERWSEWRPDPNLLIQEKNAAVLKGLAWSCAESEDAEVARALTALALSAYRKVPQVGPRCARVGNACVWALGNMPGTEGIGQLALLKVRAKFGTAQKGIEKALNSAADRVGLPREEIEETSVPTYGLQEEVGVRREQLGEFGVELVVTGTSTTELRWVKPNGKRQKSVPMVVKEHHAEELKELKAAAKDVQKMLPAQRDRIENFYLEQKNWPFPLWRERYLDHPLVGTLARRLIWRFSSGSRVAAGVFYDGQIVGRDGHALGWLDDAARVELWHPINEVPDEVLAWRDWLAKLEIRQPFKQAHREVYLLTDAERTTRVYSNRFAAHIIKQHQFNALCGARVEEQAEAHGRR